MPTTCAFQLDRPQPIYKSGEYISGRILLRTDKTKRVNAVFVTLEGEAKVQWSIKSINYLGHQQYLHTRASVYDRSTEFQAGTHVYVLSLRIPYDCPSSCRGPYGQIAYSISLTIKKPWAIDEVFHKPILVVQTLNLNVYPEYGMPFTDDDTKYFCHWPCSSGPICSTLVLPYSGFVPKQYISYLLEVDNQSAHYDVTGVEALLKQHFVFLARRPLKRNFYTKTLAMGVITEQTLRLTKRLYEGSVRVPAATPRSTLNANFIVFIHYTLEVRMRTGCLHYDTSISAPVVIGTVPLQHQNVLVTSQPTLRSRDHEDRLEMAEMTGMAPGDHNGLSLSDQQSLDARREVERRLHQRRRRRRRARQNGAEGTGDGAAAGGGGGDDDDDEGSAVETGSAVAVEDELPPSYDSCLPPSFSYATLGSEPTLDNSLSASVCGDTHIEPATSRMGRARLAKPEEDDDNANGNDDDDDDDDNCNRVENKRCQQRKQQQQRMQQQLQQHKQQQRHHQRILMPQFPEFRTTTTTPQANATNATTSASIAGAPAASLTTTPTATRHSSRGSSRDSLLQRSPLSKSYGSLSTNCTGRSLDTFTSSCNMLHEHGESSDDDDEDIF